MLTDLLDLYCNLNQPHIPRCFESLERFCLRAFLKRSIPTRLVNSSPFSRHLLGISRHLPATIPRHPYQLWWACFMMSVLQIRKLGFRGKVKSRSCTSKSRGKYPSLWTPHQVFSTLQHLHSGKSCPEPEQKWQVCRVVFVALLLTSPFSPTSRAPNLPSPPTKHTHSHMPHSLASSPAALIY